MGVAWGTFTRHFVSVVVAIVLVLAAAGCGGEATDSTSTDEKEPVDGGGRRAPFDCVSFVQGVGIRDPALTECACEECGTVIEACAPENCVLVCTASEPPSCAEGPAKRARDCVTAACVER
jgi:hypothetical protein